MKRYAFFFTLDLNGKPVEAMGTDGFLPLDGRLSLRNCYVEAANHLNRLNNGINKGYVGFEIRSTSGTRIFENYRVLSSHGQTR